MTYQHMSDARLCHHTNPCIDRIMGRAVFKSHCRATQSNIKVTNDVANLYESLETVEVAPDTFNYQDTIKRRQIISSLGKT